VIPLKDYNPTRHFPYLTVLLIAANVLVYFFVQRPLETTEAGQIEFVLEVAAIPCEVVTGRPLSYEEITRTFDFEDDEACDRSLPSRADDPACELARRPSTCPAFPGKSVWLSILSSMFLHGSILHLGGNMLFLWIFGNNIEDRMRTIPYLIFYLASGLVAAIAHIAVAPNSTLPVVGASGAVAGVMGAYLVLFPTVPIRTLLFLFVFVLFRDIPAMWLLGFWFVLQFFTSPDTGVAWVAHVGGFVFGAFVALLLREKLRPSRVRLPTY
jgi:membrane associated rhomboid family serine protease